MLFRKIKRSRPIKTEEKIKKKSSALEQIKNLSVVHKETYHVVEKELLKWKTSWDYNLDKNNIPLKIRKTENVNTLLTEIPKILNASKSVIDNSLEAFGLSNLNPYRCVDNEPSNKTKTYASISFENYSKPVPNISKRCVMKKLDKSSLVLTDANSKKFQTHF